jgi:hypothetical protein
MKYQLVLQWSEFSSKDYDLLIEIEDILIDNLDNSCEIDGHDVGSGQMNIFIHTDDPKMTFNSIKTLLDSRDFWSDVRIAYREIAGGDYTVLWPKNLYEFNIT